MANLTVVKKDMFNIVSRLKKIDKGYFVVFNNKTNHYEVHNSNQAFNTYCLTSPYDKLDCRLLDYVLKTSLVNNPNLLKDIDINNEKVVDKANEQRSNMVDSCLKDVYSVVNSSSRSYDLYRSFKTRWL